jgi:hypothetical protein
VELSNVEFKQTNCFLTGIEVQCCFSGRQSNRPCLGTGKTLATPKPPCCGPSPHRPSAQKAALRWQLLMLATATATGA